MTNPSPSRQGLEQTIVLEKLRQFCKGLPASMAICSNAPRL
jgi:hypothetical protein